MKIEKFSQAIDPNTVKGFRIVPSGIFLPSDGREVSTGSWNMDPKKASNVITESFANRREILIDYEHQSLNSAKNGQPVPAAGWFSAMEWREGLGLYAINIAWNSRALEMIKAHEYRFISPVIAFDSNGNVVKILSIALTNTPALSYLTDLSQVPLSAQPAQMDYRNQNGYDLLSRMVDSSETAMSRQRPASAHVEPIPLNAVHSAATENQRGMELLYRMCQK